MSVNGVWQLEKLTLRYCKSSGSSAGVRELLRNGAAAFAERNPHLKIEAVQEPMKAPRVIGRYRDGTRKEIDVKNKAPAEVAGVMQRLRNAATASRRSFRKPVQGGTPSVQGVWDPSITYAGFALREARVPARTQAAVDAAKLQ